MMEDKSEGSDETYRLIITPQDAILTSYLAWN